MDNGRIIYAEDKKMTQSQRDAIRIAKDLRYRKEVIEKIKTAKTDNEITRIMKDAREQL